MCWAPAPGQENESNDWLAPRWLDSLLEQQPSRFQSGESHQATSTSLPYYWLRESESVECLLTEEMIPRGMNV